MLSLLPLPCLLGTRRQ
ncbi:hypothetical protein [Brevibacillus sp. DP1.3A]|nr:hypothetical protein HP399_011820 [Brevibacillus sp. DP1.3A]